VKTSVVGLVLAGGLGVRFGQPRPKQITPLGGMPLLFHVLRKFDDHDAVHSIVVPAHPSWLPEIEAIVEQAVRSKPWRVVPGGRTRNESVVAALSVIDDDEAVVVVHDGARPLVSHQLLAHAIESAEGADAVLPVIPIVDLVLEVEGDQLRRFVPRDRLRRGQTPQVFWLSRLRLAFAALDSADVAACSTLYEALLLHDPQLEVRIIEGDERNIKVTAPLDRLIAGQLLIADGTP
jgi:2-C-methyl-D-erythritol 4-phosphate cytidylyltransferase